MAQFRTAIAVLMVIQCSSILVLIRNTPNIRPIHTDDMIGEVREKQFEVTHQAAPQSEQNYIAGDDIEESPMEHLIINGYHKGETLYALLQMIPFHPLPKISMTSAFEVSDDAYKPLFDTNKEYWKLDSLFMRGYKKAPKRSPEEEKIYSFLQESRMNSSKQFSLDNDSRKEFSSSNVSLHYEQILKTKKLAHELQERLTNKSINCKKKVKLGGRYCKKMPDGEK